MRKQDRAVSICTAAAAAWLMGAAAFAQAPGAAEGLPAFKGGWQGPSKSLPPGPGPQPGQSIRDYIQSLPVGDRSVQKKHVLVLGGTKSFHHDSVTASMDMVFQQGQASNQWITEFATDFALINPGGGGPMRAGFQPKGLKDFDAVVIANATGEWGLTDEQKAALLAFVHDEGKGLVVIHAGIDANHQWRDYIDMIGGEMTGHPYNTNLKVLIPFKMVNESPDFPAVRHLPHTFRMQEEIYAMRNFTRSDINVLLRLDEAAQHENDRPGIETQLPPDRDIPVAWTKRYGKGRVFVSSIGHPPEAFVDPDVTTMYGQAIKWALGLTDGDEKPHAKR